VEKYGNYIHNYISPFLQKSSLGPHFVLDYIGVVIYYRDMKNTYAVYVSDANGWDDGCPDSEGVFFGSPKEHGGQFFRHAHLLPENIDANVDLGSQGFVVVEGYRAAVALRNTLDCTGDWVAPEEVNPEGEESRPAYAIRKLEAR
jgi:hypothetical protein